MNCNLFIDICNFFPHNSSLNFYLLISQLSHTATKILSVSTVYIVQPLRFLETSEDGAF